MTISSQFAPLQFGQINAFNKPRFGAADDADAELDLDGDSVDLSGTTTNEAGDVGGPQKTTLETSTSTDNNNILDEALDNLREKAHPFAQKAAQFLMGIFKVLEGIANGIGGVIEMLAKTISGGDEEKAQTLLMKWHGINPDEAKEKAHEMIQQQVIGLCTMLGMDPQPMLEKFEAIKETLGSDTPPENSIKVKEEPYPNTGQYL